MEEDGLDIRLSYVGAYKALMGIKLVTNEMPALRALFEDLVAALEVAKANVEKAESEAN